VLRAGNIGHGRVHFDDRSATRVKPTEVAVKDDEGRSRVRPHHWVLAVILLLLLLIWVMPAGSGLVAVV